MAEAKRRVLKELLDYAQIVESSFTKEEGLAYYKELIRQITALERRLLEKADKVNRNVQTQADQNTAYIKDEMNRFEAKVSTKTDTLFEEVRAGLNVVYDKLKEVYSYIDNKGETVKQEALALFPEMPEMKTDTPQELVNKLESLKGTERLNMSAIEGLEDELKNIKESSTRRVGGGGASDSTVKFALSRILLAETPSGTINGTNKVFTVTQDIHSVLSFAINGMVIHSSEYTTSSKTITFVTAPPAELSGTSFEIIYV